MDTLRVSNMSAHPLEAGKGSTLVEADIKDAYRMLPIHPEDQGLLGIQREGEFYTDKALPFGLRSTTKIFIAVADALQWILLNKGIKNLPYTVHYLDDFISLRRILWPISKFYYTPFPNWGLP